MSNRTFTLSTEITQLPLMVTEVALEDFQEQGLGAMDECIVRLVEQSIPVSAPNDDPQMDIVGQMMLDGAATGNTRKIILCALWLAHYHPDATGLVSNGSKFHYVYGETDAQPQSQPQSQGQSPLMQACA